MMNRLNKLNVVGMCVVAYSLEQFYYLIELSKSKTLSSILTLHKVVFPIAETNLL